MSDAAKTRPQPNPAVVYGTVGEKAIVSLVANGVIVDLDWPGYADRMGRDQDRHVFTDPRAAGDLIAAWCGAAPVRDGTPRMVPGPEFDGADETPISSALANSARSVRVDSDLLMVIQGSDAGICLDRDGALRLAARLIYIANQPANQPANRTESGS
jgi:hypothetical protein